MSPTLVLALALPLFAPQKTPSTDGVWVVAAAEMSGEPAPPQIFAKMTLTLKGDTYDLWDGQKHDRGRVIRNPKRSPMEMDIKGLEGPNKGKTIPTIYKFEKDRLIVCYNMAGARPTKFETKKDTALLLINYKRKDSK